MTPKSESLNLVKLFVWALLIISLMGGVFLVIYYFYIYVPNHPKEPVASGDFPSTTAWIFLGDSVVTSTPVTDGNNIFIRTNNSIYALDGRTGEILWKTNSRATGSSGESTPTISPQIEDSYLIVPETGSRISVFSSESGKLIWSSYPEYAHTHIESIAINNKTIYVARWNWRLTSYGLETGDIIWEKDISGRSNPYVVANENAVYLGQEHLLQSLEAESGISQWELDFGGYSGPLAINDGVLYITDEETSSVLAIDTNTQAVLWERSYPQIEAFELNCLVLSGDVLYLAAQQLIAISKVDGYSLWISSNTGRLECPNVSSDSIYVRNTEQTLYKLDVSSGNKTGQLSVQLNTPMKHEPDRSPLLFEDMLIVPFGDNRVFAYLINE
jgi:outer membrane protein assembly factor BamB